MQPIERYGLIALVFLGITITAAVVWEPTPAEGATDGDVAQVETKVDKEVPATQSRDFVGARSSGGARRQGQGLSQQKHKELLALQGAPKSAGANGGTRESQPKAGFGAGPKRILGDQIVSQPAAGTPPSSKKKASQPLRGSDSNVASLEVKPHSKPKAEQKPEPSREQVAPRRSERTYRIQAGDTLSEIAERELGSSARWNEIVKLNPGLDPLRLRADARIKLPAGGSAAATSSKPSQPTKKEDQPAPGKGPVHVVQENESLWRIAARRLGDGARWNEIAKLNPDIDPDRVKAGMKLRLPASAFEAERGATRQSAAAPQTAQASAPKRGRVQ